MHIQPPSKLIPTAGTSKLGFGNENWGTYIAFDGPDGTGKSTLVKRVAEALTAKGHEVLTIREPGSTELGVQLRSILMSTEVPIEVAIMLFAADRAVTMKELVIPALKAGKVVLTDRSLLSSLVYQGRMNGSDMTDMVTSVHKAIPGFFVPDLIMLCQTSVKTALSRINVRSSNGEKATIFDMKSNDYHKRVHQLFDSSPLWSSLPIVRLDCDRDQDPILKGAMTYVENAIQKRYRDYHKNIASHLSTLGHDTL